MWRWRELVVEAHRNLGPRHLIHGLLLTLLVGAVAFAHASAFAGALDQQRRLEAAGATVWVARQADGRALPGPACDALGANEAVRAAGGVRRGLPDEVTLASTGQHLSTLWATPGALSVWNASPTGIALGRGYAATGAVWVGSPVVSSLTGTTSPVTEFLPRGVPDILNSNLVVVQAATFDVDECWVRMDPARMSAGSDLIYYAFAGTKARVEPALPTSSAVSSPQAQWESFRILRLWLTAGVAGGLAAGLLAWTRRSEIAVYRTFGTRAFALHVILGIESFIVHVAGWATGTSLSLLAATIAVNTPGTAAEIILRAGSATALIAFGISIILVLPLGRGDLLFSLKNR